MENRFTTKLSDVHLNASEEYLSQAVRIDTDGTVFSDGRPASEPLYSRAQLHATLALVYQNRGQ